MLEFWGAVSHILAALTVSQFTWLAILAAKKCWEAVYRQQRSLWLLMGLFAIIMVGRVSLLDAPLLSAAALGDTTAVRRLLTCGADPNFKRDATPLHHAVDNGHVEIVEMLLDSGADPHRICAYSSFRRRLSPLDLARFHNNPLQQRPDLIERMASVPYVP
jgi:hypothetical protein